MMNDKNTSIESLIMGGFLGAGLGALLSKDKEEGAALGALLGAAIAATFHAGEEARKTNLPIFVEEKGILYEVSPSGEKRFVKKLKKPSRQIPEQFKLD